MNTVVRDKTWDIVKALGIIFVVTAHTRLPDQMRSFIYLFHMGLFFFVGGWFLKKDKTPSLKTFKLYVTKKVKALYRPYLIFGLAMVFAQNIFYHIGWLKVEYSLLDIVKYAFATILFAGPLGLGIAFWFLHSLFVSLIIVYLLTHFVKSEWLQFLIVLALYSIGWTTARYLFYIPLGLTRDLPTVILVWVGYFCRNCKDVLPPPPPLQKYCTTIGTYTYR